MWTGFKKTILWFLAFCVMGAAIFFSGYYFSKYMEGKKKPDVAPTAFPSESTDVEFQDVESVEAGWVMYHPQQTVDSLKKEIGELTRKLIKAEKIPHTVVEKVTSFVVDDFDEIEYQPLIDTTSILEKKRVQYFSRKTLAIDQFSEVTIVALGPSIADSLGLEDVTIGYNHWYAKRKAPMIRSEIADDALEHIFYGALVGVVGTYLLTR